MNKDGKTALMFAAEKGHKEIVELLLDKGANIEAVDKDGNTVLDRVDKGGGSFMIELFNKYLDEGI